MGSSVDFKYAKNALAAGASPWTPLGELTTPPRPLTWGWMEEGSKGPCPSPKHG